MLMPERDELEERYAKVLAAMVLPPETVKHMQQCDDGQKWDLICKQEKMSSKQSPAFYLEKLKTYLDPKSARGSLRRKKSNNGTSTQVLRDLEISLRTNNIEWVREFLNEDNLGLNVLLEYLSFRLLFLRHDEVLHHDEEVISNVGTISSKRSLVRTESMKLQKAAKNIISELVLREAKDDIHLCVMCLRAIMNNEYGFNMVFEHPQAINYIALSLNHESLRTKALVLELLAAIGLVTGGHQIILNAFDNFMGVCMEKKRFQTLMEYFFRYEEFNNVDFMVACMQFVNIIVHSVENMNFRVHLQHEFTQLGLDDYLENLRDTESEKLQAHVSAYLGNVFDVGVLVEELETQSAALEHMVDLEEQLSKANEQTQEMENDLMARLVELETRLEVVMRQRDELSELQNQTDEELKSLQKAVSLKEEQSRQSQIRPQSKIQVGPLSGNDVSSVTASLPPPPMSGVVQTPADEMYIKKKFHPKCKLPNLNWIPLKPNQVKGTVFSEMEDEKLHNIIDFDEFEEQFKLSSCAAFSQESDDIYGSKSFKVPEKVTLLEHSRLRNVAISRRKVALPCDLVVKAINALDLKTLSQENVELLLRMVPNETETKAYKTYEDDRKPIDALTDEDEFLLHLSKVEMLSQKLNIMSYMVSFTENIQLVTPQIHAVTAASRSVRNSDKMKKILELILAFGNYMNSSKRAYGFKLQSLDLLAGTKTVDRQLSLLHYIADTVRRKFPDVSNFDGELRFVEKAASVSLENILTDVRDLEKGMELCRKEVQLRHDTTDAQVLRDFLSNHEEVLTKLKNDAKIAQEAYSDCVEYFGESVPSMAANEFFSLFARFTKAFKQAENENESRRRRQGSAEREARQCGSESVAKTYNLNSTKNSPNAGFSKLKSRTRHVAGTKLLKRGDFSSGSLEDIISRIKNEPFHRADGLSRSREEFFYRSREEFV